MTKGSTLRPLRVWMAIILVSALSGGAALGSAGSEAKEKPTESYRLKLFQMDGPFGERPDTMTMSLVDSSSGDVFELIKELETCAKKKEADGILLNFESGDLSWAHADHLRRALLKVKEEGLPVYAYIENPSLRAYLTASVCDEIIITPTGDVPLTGLAGEAYYLKELMDKVGLEADFIHIGDYKSAAEPLTRTGPSEAELEQTNRLFDGLYDHMVRSIATGRGMSVKKVKKLINRGPYSAGAALKAGLVDRVAYRDEFLAGLAHEKKQVVAVSKPAEKRQGAGMDFNNPLSMFSLFGSLMKPEAAPSGDLIAVIHVKGAIVAGESDDGISGSSCGSRTLRLAIKKAGQNPQIKAIVVRIDSPGGSATASDIIYHALAEVGQKKPVIVSMGSVAASGGYYIACGGQEIFAEPSTLTGSIGVVGGKITMQELLDKIGVSTYRFERGKNAGMFSSTELFSDSQRQRLTREMGKIYTVFKQVVDKSRGDRLADDVEALAQGQVYTGGQAKELGLVDAFGGLEEAIARAGEKAGLTSWSVVHLPEPKNLLEVLEGLLADNGGRTAPMARQTAGVLAEWLAGGHPSSRQVVDYYRQIWGILQQEQVIMAMPTLILID